MSNKKSFRPAYVLNIIGLAIAFAAFMILMMQVRYDYRYDRCYPEYEKMYRLESNDMGRGFSNYLWGTGDSIADYLSKQEDVESFCFVNHCGDYFLQNGERISDTLMFCYICDKDIFDFFGIECVSGSFKDLRDDSEVAIPKSTARALFGEEDPIGKTVFRKDGNDDKETPSESESVTIVAVYKDLQENSTIGNPVFGMRSPHIEYDLVKFNKDSMDKEWNDAEAYEAFFEAAVEKTDGQLIAFFQLCSKACLDNAGDYSGALSASDFEQTFNVRDANGHKTEQQVVLNASTNAQDGAPVILKSRVVKPTPNGSLYCKLKAGCASDKLAMDIQERFYKQKGDSSVIRFTPMKELHFETGMITSEQIKTTTHFVVYTLLGIAIVILLIAVVNFAHFAMAIMPFRIRKINALKVVGFSNARLRWRQISEFMLIALGAFGLSVLLVWLCDCIHIIPVLTADISVCDNVAFMLICGMGALLIGVVVSLYPAFYATKLSPVVALRSNYGLTRSGRRLRDVFIGLQFLLSFTILTGALFVAVQTHFMQYYDMGYETDHILWTKVDLNSSQILSFVETLQKQPAILDATASSNHVIGTGYCMIGCKINGEYAEFEVNQVFQNFLEFFGVKLTAGKYFGKCDRKDSGYYTIFNETARRKYDIHLRDTYSSMLNLKESEVVGFMKDVKFNSLYEPTVPAALIVGRDGMLLKYFFVKYDGADTARAAQAVRDVARTFGVKGDVVVTPLENTIAAFYKKEADLTHLLFLFCAISVFLSLMGVASIVLLDMRFRRSELGIRRVYGADNKELVWKENLRYIIISAISFALSVPLSFWLIHRWVQSYAYRAAVPVWIFIVAFISILVLTLLIVTIQAARALKFNPAEVVNNE